MKRTLITLICLCSLTACLAQANPIAMHLQDVPEWQGPRKAPIILPTVYFEDGILSIQSTIPLSDVTVIIRDDEGTLLYTNLIYSVTGIYDLSLPSSILDDMYSVELLYGSIHLIGYF